MVGVNGLKRSLKETVSIHIGACGNSGMVYSKLLCCEDKREGQAPYAACPSQEFHGSKARRYELG